MSDPNQMQPVQPPVQQPIQPAQPQRTTVCGIVGIVFGALAVVLSFIPIINNLAFVLALVGFVLGIIAIVGVIRGKKQGKALSIVAIVLSVIAMVVTLSMQSAASKAFDEALGTSSSNSESKSKDSNDSQGSNDASSKNDTMENEGTLKNFSVKIESAALSGKDYNGNDTVLVTYEWKNLSGKNNAFATVAHPQVFQSGQALETAIYSDQPEGYDANSYLSELQPDASGKVTLGYVLKDHSPITVEVSDFLSFDSNAKVERKFDL